MSVFLGMHLRHKYLYLEEKLCTSQKINIVLKPWHLIQGIPDTPEPEPPTGAPVAPEQTTQQTSPASNPPATGGGSLSMPAAGQTGGLYYRNLSSPYVTSRNCSKAKEGKSLWKFWCTLCSCLLFDQGNSLKIPIVNI